MAATTIRIFGRISNDSPWIDLCPGISFADAAKWIDRDRAEHAAALEDGQADTSSYKIEEVEVDAEDSDPMDNFNYVGSRHHY